MEIEIQDRGAFGSALVHLQPGEEFMSESGAMFRASKNIDIDVTRKPRGGGGILSGVKRLLAAEHFFMSRYQVTDTQPGEVGLAPVLQGEVRTVTADGQNHWVCTGGSYLGSTPELAINTRFQGVKGMFSGESLFFLEVAGRGELLVNAFGRITEVEVQGGIIVDTGHVVAFESSLDYSLTKAGGSWWHSFLGGEGVVMEFEGDGRLLVQSHNASAFGASVGRLLPPRS